LSASWQRLTCGFVVLFLSSSLPAAELHRAGTGDPATLDPHRFEDPWEATIIMDLFQGLTTFTPDMQVVPGQAESWHVSDDGLTYTFQLRPGLHWSDGTPLNAYDFEYSFQRILDPATGSPTAARHFVLRNASQVFAGELPAAELGVKALAPLQLEMTLEHPAPFYPEVLASRGMPVPRHVIERAGGRWIQPGKLVSNGPFSLVEWVPNQHVKLVRNPQFFDAAKVQLDAVYHHSGEDANMSVRQFRAGEMDVVVTVPSEQLEFLKRELGSELHLVPGFGLQHYVFNTEEPPFNDVRVRRALAMAIDREILVSKITRSGERPAFGLVPPQVRYYPQQAQADFAGWSQAKRASTAKELLKAAGYGPGNPLEVSLSYNTNEIHKRVALAVSAMWRGVGVKTILNNKEAKVLLADMRNGDFEVGRYLWLGLTQDALSFLERLHGEAGPINQSRFSDPDYDQLLDQAVLTNDLEARAAMLYQAEARALAAMPVIPLYYYAGRRLVSSKVSGWVHNSRGINLARDLAVTE
jgi:oligopeptide transport system substrate-binding protein